MECLDTLIREVQNGDTEGFETIINLFQKQLYKYIYHMIGNVHEAEDILQEVFIKAYKNIDKYKVSISFSAWLYKIAYNQCINSIRKRSLFKVVDMFDLNRVSDKTSSEQVDKELGFDENIEIALSKLKADERSLLMMRIFQERSYQELSEIYDKSPSALRKKYERAKKKFQKYYEGLKGKEYERYAN